MDEKQRSENTKEVMIWLRCIYGLMTSVEISIPLNKVPGIAISHGTGRLSTSTYSHTFFLFLVATNMAHAVLEQCKRKAGNVLDRNFLNQAQHFFSISEPVLNLLYVSKSGCACFNCFWFISLILSSQLRTIYPRCFNDFLLRRC
jgi:hypothetical protein